MSGDHNMHQKPRSYLDDFECPRCGHCCQNKTEAMQQALDMLNEIADEVYCDQRVEEVITALEQALEAERNDLAKVGEVGVWGDDEPVAWRSTSPDGKLSNKFVGTSKEVNWTPIYTEPPKREWQGLTGDEARKFYEKYTDREELIYAIDKFLEEKNT